MRKWEEIGGQLDLEVKPTMAVIKSPRKIKVMSSKQKDDSPKKKREKKEEAKVATSEPQQSKDKKSKHWTQSEND